MSLDPLHRPILFSEPDRAVWPPSWIGHIPFAFWLIEAFKPDTLVELGTHTGNSFSAFCQAVTTLDLPTRCFAVDTWAGDPQAGYYGDAIYDELAPLLQSRYPCAALLRMTFDEALSHFADGSVDLLHIDGFHTYEAVSHDFVTWLPKLSRRGVVLFHDTTVRLDSYEVWRFWDEVSRRYPSLAFAHCNGLGVLLVGAEVPAPVRWLVEATAERAEIQRFFERLGHRLEAVFNQQEQHRLIEQLRRTIAETLETHKQTTENRDQEIHRLNGVVAKASEDLIALGRMVNDRDAGLDRLDTEIVELNRALRRAFDEIAAAREALTGRDGEIGGLRGALEAALAGIADRDALAATLRTQLAAARSLRGQARRLVRGAGRRLLRVLPEPLKTRFRLRWAERLIRDSGLFDDAYYLETYPEAKAAGLDPLAHYLHRGAALGNRPNPLFDPAYYLDSHPEVAASGQNPLIHYLRWGAAAGTGPNPLFDPAYYLDRHPEVQAAGHNPLAHYLRWGRAAGHRTSPLFDPAYYLETYPEVQAAGHDPLAHYLRWGQIARHRTHLLFDPAFYLETYPDVAAGGLDPVQHYVCRGAAEGRRPHPLFDPAFYLGTYPDVAAAGLDPLVHYLRWGAAEGRRPNPLFDPAFYLKSYPEVAKLGLNPLYHYLRWGAAEGRWSCRQFHGGFYLETYPDVARLGLNPLHHYLRRGAAEGRSPRRSLRSDEEPRVLPTVPDPGDALTLLPFPVPASPAPAVSIIIPVLPGGLADALCGLHRLGRQTRPCAANRGGACEVIAVYAGDDPDARQALARVGGLILAPVPSGTGLAAAWNHGAGQARGERLVFLASDVIVQEGWLDELVWSLDHLPRAGLVGALVVGADGWIEAEGGTLRRDGSLTLEGRGEDPALPEHGHARTVCWCPAGALIVATALFHRVGGFDPAAWAALRPELTLALAIRTAGFKLYVQSTAVVVRLPAGDGGERTAAVWPAATRVPPDPRWAALLEHAPIPAVTEHERERALGRRHLLVIDRRLPLSDQDVHGQDVCGQEAMDREPAGLTALMLLFGDLGYRVTFAASALPPDRTPAVRALERRGIRVLRQQTDISVLSFLYRDEIVIDMVLFAHPGVAAVFEPEIAELASTRMLASMGMLTESRNRRPSLPELSGPPSASSRVLWANGLTVRAPEAGGLALPEAGSDGWHQGRAGLDVLRDMVLTLVGNGTERDALRQAVPDCPTLVMPPIVPVPVVQSGTGFGFAERADVVLPACFDDWPDGEAAVAFVLDEWPQISRRLPGVRLVILAMGHVPPVIRALQSAEILVREGAGQPGAGLARARLAVAPHRSWGGFNQAVATALAHGVPAVLSPPVAHGLGLGTDDPGLVAEPGAAFVERVVAAYGDEPSWTRLSAAGVRHAAGHWSAETVRQRLLQMLHRARFTPTYEISERLQRQALAAKGAIG